MWNVLPYAGGMADQDDTLIDLMNMVPFTRNSWKRNHEGDWGGMSAGQYKFINEIKVAAKQ